MICEGCGEEEAGYFTEAYDPSVPTHRTYRLCRACQIAAARATVKAIEERRLR